MTNGQSIKVSYIDHMGNDSRVVDAARVSFDKIAENYTEEQNAKLIKYLAKHNHFTPFTHPQVTLMEEVPVFVCRQRFKHFIGFSYNEVSRRYVDGTPSFFNPDSFRSRPDRGIKQGSADIHKNSNEWMSRLDDWCYESRKIYEEAIDDGVAPEQARMFLPQAMMTSYYVTGSLSAFSRAYKLRSHDSSQKEIRDLAVRWDEIIRPLFPVSWPALVE